MRRLPFPTPVAAGLALVLALAGCTATPYDQRMQFLDEMTEAGITYRSELQKQGTAPSAEACQIGWDLLQADPPYDDHLWTTSEQWGNQVEEAYVKGCMTGEPRPKPEPSGTGAVTPVPVGSEKPRSPSPSPS